MINNNMFDRNVREPNGFVRIVMSVSLFFVIVACPLSSWADRIVLKEGKTLNGKITAEDPHQVTIVLGQNMTLRVNRQDIKKIIRAERKSRPKGEVVTLDSLKSVEKGSPKPEREHEVKKTISPKKPAAVEVEGVKIVATDREKTYKISAPSFETALSKILSKKKGGGFSSPYGRAASLSTWQMNYFGDPTREGHQFVWRNLIVEATMTVTFPSWVNADRKGEQQKALWRQYRKELRGHEEGHARIYRRSMKSLARSLSKLSAKTEDALRDTSEQIYRRLLDRVEKQQKGYDHRAAKKRVRDKPVSN